MGIIYSVAVSIRSIDRCVATDFFDLVIVEVFLGSATPKHHRPPVLQE